MKKQIFKTTCFVFCAVILITFNARGVDNPQSIENLVQLLQDNEKGLDAARALSKIGIEAVPALIKVLEDTAHPAKITRQVNAMLALMKMGIAASDAGPVVKQILGPLNVQSYNCRVRYIATICIVYICPGETGYSSYLKQAHLASSACKAPLLRFLGEEENERNSQVVKALIHNLEYTAASARKGMEIEEDPDEIAALASIGPPALAQVADTLINHEEPLMRSWAASILGQMKEEAVPAVPVLGEALKDKDMSVGTSVLEAIKTLGPYAAAAVPALIDVLDQSRNEKNREMVIVALEKIGPGASAAVPVLQKIKRSHPDLADYVDRAIATITDPDNILKNLVEEKGCDAISELVNMLKIYRGDSSILPIIEALQTFGPSSVPYLIDAQKTGNPDTTLNILTAFSRLGPLAREAVPELIPLLENENQLIRRLAAEALGKIGPGAAVAVPHLEKLLTDKEDFIRSIARTALARIRVIRFEKN
jgi:HEAT repeat protein